MGLKDEALMEIGFDEAGLAVGAVNIFIQLVVIQARGDVLE